MFIHVGAAIRSCINRGQGNPYVSTCIHIGEVVVGVGLEGFLQRCWSATLCASYVPAM